MGQVLGLYGIDHRKKSELVFRSWARSSDTGGAKQLFLQADEVYRYFSELGLPITVEMANRLLGYMIHGKGEGEPPAEDQIMLQQFTHFVEENFSPDFMRLDSNKDGFIDLLECVRSLKKTLVGVNPELKSQPEQLSKELLPAVKAIMKYDHGDGKVSFHEYIEGRVKDLIIQMSNRETLGSIRS